MLRRSQRLNKALPHEGNSSARVMLGDPIALLPDLCIEEVFSYLTPIQLIGIQRVSKSWRDAVDWRFGKKAFWKQWFPKLATDDGKVNYDSWQEASTAFKRAVYRRETRARGEPTYIQKFSGAHQGWAICGDYFVWIDSEAVNIQRVFSLEDPGNMPGPIRRLKLSSLFKHPVYANCPRIDYIQAQETGVADGPPLLGLFGVHKEHDWTFTCIHRSQLVTVIDIEQGKPLWSHYEATGAVHHYTLNHKTLSFTHTIVSNNDLILTLKVLDVKTGKLQSNPRLDFIPRIKVQRVRAHPRRELIFIMLNDEFVTFSTSTHDWVGRVKLPTLAATGRPSSFAPFMRWPWELKFDEYGPSGTNAREMLMIFGVQSFSHSPRDLWTIHNFELPTEKELESGDGEANAEFPKKTTDSVPKPINNWIRGPVEVVWVSDGMPTNNGYNGFNPKTKQLCIKGIVNRKNGKLAIVTYEEEEGAPERFVLTGLPEETSARAKQNDPPIKIKYYKMSTRSDITKVKKRMPKKTSYADRRTLAFLPKAGTVVGGPVLKERYVVFYQGGTDVYLMSFAPSW